MTIFLGACFPDTIFSLRAGAVLNVLRPSPDVNRHNNSILITGLGAVGCAALFASLYLKLGNVIVIDVIQSRLDLAKSLGAHHALDGRASDIVDQVRSVTGGLGARWAVECTGNTKVLGNAFASLSNFGHLAICGTPGPPHLPPFQIHDTVNTSRTFTVSLSRQSSHDGVDAGSQSTGCSRGRLESARS